MGCENETMFILVINHMKHLIESSPNNRLNMINENMR